MPTMTMIVSTTNPPPRAMARNNRSATPTGARDVRRTGADGGSVGAIRSPGRVINSAMAIIPWPWAGLSVGSGAGWSVRPSSGLLGLGDGGQCTCGKGAVVVPQDDAAVSDLCLADRFGEAAEAVAAVAFPLVPVRAGRDRDL